MYWIWVALCCWASIGYGRRLTLDASQRSLTSVNHKLSETRDQKVSRPRQSLATMLLARDPSNAYKVGLDKRPPVGSSQAARQRLASPLEASAGKILMPSAEAALPLKQRLRQRPPKMAPVAYKVPNITSEEWIKRYGRFYPERITLLSQELEDFVVNQIITNMLFMDAETSDRPIHLYINSPGGSVIAGLALFDTMQHIKSPVYTCNLGMAASMASFILGAGVRGKRVALPNSRVMIHQPASGGTQAQDPRVEAEQILKIKDTVITMYAHMTGHTREKIEQDLSFDNYMSAQEALAYGLIDHIPDMDLP